MRKGLLVFTVMAFLASWVHPLWPYEQGLHSVLTMAGLVLLWLFRRKEWMTDGRFALLCLFMLAQIVGSRWLYSNVPYERWGQALSGFSINGAFGFTRNNYDRLTHFLYGLCVTPVFAAAFRARWPLSSRQSVILAAGAVMVSGLVYEWLELGVALVMSPEDAEAYNGQQGDIWDPLKDTLMAAAGAGIAALVPLVRGKGEKAG